MAKEHHAISRREFNAQSLLAMLAGVTLTLSGCGSDDPAQPTPTDETGSISNNHGHAATVTGVQLSAGGAVTLDIQAGATHNHQLSLTAAEIVQIRNGTSLSKTTTTTNAHEHTITFN